MLQMQIFKLKIGNEMQKEDVVQLLEREDVKVGKLLSSLAFPRKTHTHTLELA